ncbi:MAG: hypothetical protein K2X55_04585 [Burkholderiaceae bacterium]|nr:hypothetical protein [Burkholderiaceae bacterium]
MNSHLIVDEYFNNGNAVTPGMASMLGDPALRHALYQALLNQPAALFRPLLLFALDLEVEFRQALFEGARLDPDGYYEGIYHCAFLLYRAGDPVDTLKLWQVKHINMDVGSSLGAEYFLGAGVEKTMALLDGWSDEDAIAIVEYINDFLIHDNWQGGREAWEAECVASLTFSPNGPTAQPIHSVPRCT